MRPTLASLDATSAPAVRLTGAVAASLALHAAAALAFVGAPLGSPTGPGSVASPPLQARIVTPPAPESPSADASSLPVRPPQTRIAAAEKPPPEASQPLGLREAPVYHLPSQLDTRPRLRSRVDPAYPQVAPPDGGYVLLRLLISEEGRVDRVLVVVADPEGFFEKAAADAFAAARFSPGKLGGIAVKSQTWIEMKFHPLVPSGSASAGGEPTP
ncbi:MAG: TonB family protein [Chloroflexi bacterium]|nr:TonB family protein [Chloroflexota bacterium]